jgi:hypothetical protein
MIHDSPEWLNWQRSRPGLQALPIGRKLILVEFRPRLDQPLLPPGECSRDQIDWIDAEDCDRVLIISVKMRCVVWNSYFREHADERIQMMWMEEYGDRA